MWRCVGKDYGLFRGLEDFHGWDMLWISRGLPTSCHDDRDEGFIRNK